MTQSFPSDDATLAHLTRLSQKSGVRSTLILDRESQTVVRTSGFATSSTNQSSTSTSTNTVSTGTSTADVSGSATEGSAGSAGAKSPERIAELVLGFVKAAGALAEGVSKEADTEEGPNDVKLLRVRTRRFECVVVPDSKYILVVVHDTPEA